MLRTPSRGFPVLGKSPRLYYPFGNTRGRNVLKDYNFHESDDNTGITKVRYITINPSCLWVPSVPSFDMFYMNMVVFITDSLFGMWRPKKNFSRNNY